MIAIREPSLGPVMGIKGWCCWWWLCPSSTDGRHQPSFHRGYACDHNSCALSALVDNHLHQGNELGIDQRRIIWKRVVDLNDRALRHLCRSWRSAQMGSREDGFDITVASEIMAILCLATNVNLKRRLCIVIGYRYDRSRSMSVIWSGRALALILKDAIKPNLVQTIYGTPAFVHGGRYPILPWM